MHLFTCTLSESTSGVHFHFWLLCLRLYFPVNNYSAMSAKWRLTVHPILGYQGEKEGGGANVLPWFFKRGQISTIMHFLRGQLHILNLECLGYTQTFKVHISLKLKSDEAI